MRLCNKLVPAAPLSTATLPITLFAMLFAILTGAPQVLAAQSAHQQSGNSQAAQSQAPKQASTQSSAGQTPSLTVDTDPVRSPDAATAPSPAPLHKEGGEGYVLHTSVDEVVLNATVISGSQLVQNLNKNDFDIYEDGVKQTILSFQHSDLPVSIGLVIDNSGSMYRKRPSVNKAALDLVEASNPSDEAFVVNFSDEAFIDQDFTASVNKLRDGLL